MTIVTAVELYQGDALAVMKTLPDGCANCGVTSPAYWGLRNYGVDGQLGLEASPDEYVTAMVAVFRELRRLLRDDGTLWLNIGDSYAGNRGEATMTVSRRRDDAPIPRSDLAIAGLKPKDLVGIPWMLAFALRADGWYLRQDIIWHKPNPMPESVTDRCTKAHEYVFLLSKSERYYCDMEAIKEQAAGVSGGGSFGPQIKVPSGWDTKPGAHGTIHREGRSGPEYKDVGVQSRTYDRPNYEKRNRRSVLDGSDEAISQGALRDLSAQADRTVHPGGVSSWRHGD
jgi:hypothetical protein